MRPSHHPLSSILTVHSPPSPSRLYLTVLLLIGADDRVFLLRLQRLIAHARTAPITVRSRYETREEICHHFLSTWTSFFSSRRGERVVSFPGKCDLFAKRLLSGGQHGSAGGRLVQSSQPTPLCTRRQLPSALMRIWCSFLIKMFIPLA